MGMDGKSEEGKKVRIRGIRWGRKRRKRKEEHLALAFGHQQPCCSFLVPLPPPLLVSSHPIAKDALFTKPGLLARRGSGRSSDPHTLPFLTHHEQPGQGGRTQQQQP